MNRGIPVLRRAGTQAEAGPLMLMVRRANMRPSIAAGRRIAKPCRGYPGILGNGLGLVSEDGPRRAAPKTRYAIKTLKPAPDPHRIDAVLEPTILVEADVGRGVAKIAAAFLAMNNHACDEPGAAEHRGGLFDLALRECHADRARGN